MNILHRNNVKISGNPTQPVLLYAHGFGCSQAMWSSITPAFDNQLQQILFDYVGSGQSDISHYSFNRYETLAGYAQDIIEICDALSINQDIIFVGHSVSCSIGILAANARPNLFKKMILLGPSPCFLNLPPDYLGGFDREDLEGLLDLMDQNYLGWASYLAPIVAGVSTDPEITGQLSESFCSTDPIITRHFATATFFSDNREDFAKLTVPSLILQHKEDSLVPLSVGDYMHQKIKNSTLNVLNVAGHAAHMSHPSLVIQAMNDYLKSELSL
ncbi:sigma factor SigB regulation protein RsbQ [Nitrincola tibetensis]|uniref:Sigma factor SigB regulation protein RsbQ n=1 Tax=Nitrincola tibetensis TaxID=2219697 RepID=A0A364NJH3_9GAMM|nr:alpha/beta hydrolase [Nitrincola tibetensis]RAU17181.1 sigma factor SigB regulation protein RsbQ [Nitrincola tibetensis]